MNAVCASDNNQTDDIIALENQEGDLQTADCENSELQSAGEEDDVLKAEDSSEEVLQASSGGSNSSIVKRVIAKHSSSNVFIKDSTFNIRILDDNGKAIAKKQVTVIFNNIKTTFTTSAKGYVLYKLNETGTFTLTYSFKAKGYETVKKSKKITVIPNNVSEIKGSNYVAYVGAKNTFSVTLTAGGVPLPGKEVYFKIHGVYYKKTTNSKGVASLGIGLVKKGNHNIKFIFKGIKNAAEPAQGKAKITVKKGMPTFIVNQKANVYTHQASTPFEIKYKDARGKAIPYHTIKFQINKKTYHVKTNKEGIAKIKIKLNKGTYTLKVSSYNTAVYKKSSNSYFIKVLSKNAADNFYGFWLFGADMKKVNLKTMAQNGINRIFLNFHAVKLYGKSAISKFAEDAKYYGIKVDIWMQVFHKNGKWTSPVNSDGSYKYTYFNSVIKEALSYAKIAGVDGIHLDYLRFPGTAYKHTNGVNAINYFTQQICSELHALNPKLLVSAAVMPEPSSMTYYYGQDIPELSKYLDVIVPMVYKGNYGRDASWIKSVTSTFESQSKGAQIWAGLQSYHSDGIVTKLSASTLKNDAASGLAGGATGIILFRYTLFNLFDFNTLGGNK